ncbi:MAG: DUF805 domain-containing protein [Candidatus Saccharimonadales bacterium]
MNILGIRSPRFNRLTYLLSIFFAMFVFVGLGVILSSLFDVAMGVKTDSFEPNPFIFLPFFLGYYLYLIMAVVKRLHDLDIHGAWSIAFAVAIFIPIVNLITGLYLLFTDGNAGDNKYGKRPQVVHVMGVVIWKKSLEIGQTV